MIPKSHLGRTCEVALCFLNPPPHQQMALKSCPDFNQCVWVMSALKCWRPFISASTSGNQVTGSIVWPQAGLRMARTLIWTSLCVSVPAPEHRLCQHVDFKRGHAELAEAGTGILLPGIVFMKIVLPLTCFSTAQCLGRVVVHIMHANTAS